jgi:hypothetical protein
MFARRGPLGGFAFGERLPSSVMNDVTLDLSSAVDGTGGGTYAPSNPIVIGGDGLTCTGQLTATGTVLLTGSSITLGNSSSDQVNINAEVTFHQDIEFNNDVQLGTDEDDDITVGGNLTCERRARFDAGVTCVGDSYFEDDLDIKKNLQVDGSIEVDESVTVGNFLTVNGNTTLGSSDSDTVRVNGLVNNRIGFTGSGRVGERIIVLEDANQTITVSDANVIIVPTFITANREYILSSVGAVSGADFMRAFFMAPSSPRNYTVSFRRSTLNNLITLDPDDTHPVLYFVFINGNWNLVGRELID